MDWIGCTHLLRQLDRRLVDVEGVHVQHWLQIAQEDAAAGGEQLLRGAGHNGVFV